MNNLLAALIGLCVLTCGGWSAWAEEQRTEGGGDGPKPLAKQEQREYSDRMRMPLMAAFAVGKNSFHLGGSTGTVLYSDKDAPKPRYRKVEWDSMQTGWVFYHEVGVKDGRLWAFSVNEPGKTRIFYHLLKGGDWVKEGEAEPVYWDWPGAETK